MYEIDNLLIFIQIGIITSMLIAKKYTYLTILCDADLLKK